MSLLRTLHRSLNRTNNFVKIVEVGPRDGIQNEKKLLSTEQKAIYLKKLVSAGTKHIEFGAFVTPRVKQMQNSDKVLNLAGISTDVNYIALVPTISYAEMAIKTGATELAVFTTVSEEFSKRNTNCTVEESISRIKGIMYLAKLCDIPVRGYISCIMGCPYEGYNKQYINRTAEIAEKLTEMGCYEISLGDTIGIGDPIKTFETINAVKKVVPIDNLAVHFHNTYGRALVNIMTALSSDIRIIDSSSGGLGGCPYAKGASGNVATEDVIDMLNIMGFKHGIDLQKLLKATNFIHTQLDKSPASLVVKAYNKKGEE
jgi:hydroxymethylglutaryl-CoA lyase